MPPHTATGESKAWHAHYFWANIFVYQKRVLCTSRGPNPSGKMCVLLENDLWAASFHTFLWCVLGREKTGQISSKLQTNMTQICAIVHTTVSWRLDDGDKKNVTNVRNRYSPQLVNQSTRCRRNVLLRDCWSEPKLKWRGLTITYFIIYLRFIWRGFEAFRHRQTDVSHATITTFNTRKFFSFIFIEVWMFFFYKYLKMKASHGGPCFRIDLKFDH